MTPMVQNRCGAIPVSHMPIFGIVGSCPILSFITRDHLGGFCSFLSHSRGHPLIVLPVTGDRQQVLRRAQMVTRFVAKMHKSFYFRRRLSGASYHTIQMTFMLF